MRFEGQGRLYKIELAGGFNKGVQLIGHALDVGVVSDDASADVVPFLPNIEVRVVEFVDLGCDFQAIFGELFKKGT